MVFNVRALASTLLLCAAVFGAAAGTVEHVEESTQPKGIDVSSHQGNVSWDAVVANGVSFAFVKATEGTSYKNPYFSSQSTGAINAGLIRGSYHFALPGDSSGIAQANYFVSNGGGWKNDGITLPGVLDIEYNPYGPDTCYGLNATSMVSWIRDFSNTYHACVGRYPMIYTTTDWWKTCTGNDAGFGSNPLWIARWASSVGTLPAGWNNHTFWQYADSGPSPGDQDYFNGDMAGLRRFAAYEPMTAK